MASMNRDERAKQYYDRLRLASNPAVETQRIIEELNGLVWSKNNQPLPRDEKLRIVESLESIVIANESHTSFSQHRDAADNGNVLELIKAIKGGTK